MGALRIVRYVAVAGIAVLAPALVLALWRGDEPPRPGTHLSQATSTPSASETAAAGAARRQAPSGEIKTSVDIGGPFTLVDHTGRTVTNETFSGSFTLIYFGYTFCPDMCPTELNDIALALEKMGERAHRVTPLFITIDPERDTADRLANYVGHFHDRLVGLTGSSEQIAEAAEAYRVHFERRETSGDRPYLMDHTSFVYLMGPQGEFLKMFRFGTPPEEMAESVFAAIERHST